jgi:alpha-N-arabinofuranosidase
LADWRRQNGRDEPWKLPYFGVGNENWACGGNMSPEYYADVYKRYQTYVRNFSGNRIYRIACGSYGDNYEWTETLMREAGGQMNGLSLHYYTVPGGWGNRNSATQFTEADWFETLKLAGKIEEYLEKHAAIMDKYDPEKRIGMIVDEWGTWYQVEAGTNPGFLFQQNTLRDALSAGLTLNIFNNHCDRVQMANLAQTVNVLQALILTEDEKMVLTPTYHVFHMYQVHQDAILLPVEVNCGSYGNGDEEIPLLSASASRNEQGNIHVSICNFDPNRDADITIELRGTKPSGVTGRVLTSERMNAHNSFENPETVFPRSLDAAKIVDDTILLKLPAKSVTVIEISN